MTDLPPRTFWESVRGVFVRGFVVLVPVYLTVWFFQAFLNAVDGILSPILDRLIGRPIPGLGFLSVLVLLFLVGLLTRNLVGRLVFGWIERFISSLPFVRSVYGAIKDLVDAINVAGGKGRSFRRVVMVQYPRLGVYSVGFVTNAGPCRIRAWDQSQSTFCQRIRSTRRCSRRSRLPSAPSVPECVDMNRNRRAGKRARG